ncbi:unnamed protein product [Blepharisma stoltei]|uniref:Nucleoporin Nup54 alpha-helical domain-containing protein n=1 Tax=Blepharisma stoltei TaxID=1481888 RepID=A0AAU9IMX3_9CILI|nr:unnamed protein product [Blepharisma stoltei]
MYSNPESELANELNTIAAAIHPYNPQNRFKVMLYNMAPKNYNIHLLHSNRYQPNEKQEYFMTDGALLNEALTKNPDPEHLYPWQINSCKQLSDRLETDLATTGLFLETLDKMETDLREVEIEMTSKASERLRKIEEGQNKLFTKLCNTRQKLEKFLESKNALQRNSGAELKLWAKIDYINRKLEIKSKLEKLNTNELRSVPALKIPDAKMNDILKLLREQKNSLSELKKNVVADKNRVQKIEENLRKVSRK